MQVCRFQTCEAFNQVNRELSLALCLILVCIVLNFGVLCLILVCFDLHAGMQVSNLSYNLLALCLILVCFDLQQVLLQSS